MTLTLIITIRYKVKSLTSSITSQFAYMALTIDIMDEHGLSNKAHYKH